MEVGGGGEVTRPKFSESELAFQGLGANWCNTEMLLAWMPDISRDSATKNENPSLTEPAQSDRGISLRNWGMKMWFCRSNSGELSTCVATDSALDMNVNCNQNPIRLDI